jgi:nucleotide-binding universal stress UspA family protein
VSIAFKKLLFPTDFSELAPDALQYARELAETFDAQLYLLHVVDEAYQHWGTLGPESLPVCPPLDDMLVLAQNRMEKFAAEHLGGMERPPITHVAMGRPFAEIIAYARENGVDLIVMATHGRGAVSHVLLGSTTEKVVRKANCAVLTIRAKDHKFSMP